MRSVSSKMSSRLVRPVGRLVSLIEWGVPVVVGVVALQLLTRTPTVTTAQSPSVVFITGLVIWIVWQDVSSFSISDAAILTLAIVAVSTRFNLARETGEPITVLVSATSSLLWPAACWWVPLGFSGHCSRQAPPVLR
jgi:hypothetical protein